MPSKEAGKVNVRFTHLYCEDCDVEFMLAVVGEKGKRWVKAILACPACGEKVSKRNDKEGGE